MDWLRTERLGGLLGSVYCAWFANSKQQREGSSFATTPVGRIDLASSCVTKAAIWQKKRKKKREKEKVKQNKIHALGQSSFSRVTVALVVLVLVSASRLSAMRAKTWA